MIHQLIVLVWPSDKDEISDVMLYMFFFHVIFVQPRNLGRDFVITWSMSEIISRKYV